MKLAAIYNVWDDWDLAERSIKNIIPVVDGVIVVYSTLSNYFEQSTEPVNFIEDIEYLKSEPIGGLLPAENEALKRNVGLNKARDWGYTHFIMLDADEFYIKSEFLAEKSRIESENLAGSIAKVKCYFLKPTLTIGLDTTLVPFIHKISPELRFTWNKHYPFAFEGDGFKKEIRIDPTRQMNINSGVEMSKVTMHHYSWIRKNFQKKIRNSTARANIQNSTIMDDLRLARDGYFCNFYGKTLEPCSDLFNLCSLRFIIEQDNYCAQHKI